MPDEPSMSEPDYSDPLSVGQDKLVATIKALPWMTAKNVPVEPERRGDIVQTIANAVNRLGVAVVVMEPINGTFDDPDVPDWIIEAEYIVEVVENVTTNRRDTSTLGEGEDAPVAATALQIMTRIVKRLHGMPSGMLNPKTPLGLWRVDKNAIRRIPHKVMSVYQTSFHVGISLADLQ